MAAVPPQVLMQALTALKGQQPPAPNVAQGLAAMQPQAPAPANPVAAGISALQAPKPPAQATDPTLIPWQAPQGTDQDRYAAAVAETKRRYPRLASMPLAMTYNAKRDRNSETFQPGDDNNPVPGHVTVEFGREPYGSHPDSWPETIALEAIHGLQESDPHYQKLTEELVKSYTSKQMAEAKARYARESKIYGTTGRNMSNFTNYLKYVDSPEFVRGGLWNNYFEKYEHYSGPSDYAPYSPKQQKIINQIKQYLQTPAEGK